MITAARATLDRVLHSWKSSPRIDRAGRDWQREYFDRIIRTPRISGRPIATSEQSYKAACEIGSGWISVKERWRRAAGSAPSRAEHSFRTFAYQPARDAAEPAGATPALLAPLQSATCLIDLIIIVAYLVAVSARGLVRRKQKTTSQYFRWQQVPWWPSAHRSYHRTSTITFISVPGIAFARGGDFTFLHSSGYLAGRIAISILFHPSYFKGDIATVYQLLQQRFGWRVRAWRHRLLAMRTIADGVRLLLTAFVLAASTQRYRRLAES